MPLAYEQAYKVGGTGQTVTSSGTSANTTIPLMADGVTKAKFVRLQVTGQLYVKFGLAGIVATTNDMLLSPNFDVIVACYPYTTIAYIQESANAKLNITPLEA